jgi:hypothetical protein
MRVIIDLNKEVIIEKIKNGIITLITFVYSWFTHEGEILGYILGVFHIIISTTIGIFIILSHTFYPEFSLQVVVFICLFIIWLQHIFFNICIVIVAEQRLTKNESPYIEFVKTILEHFGIDPNQFPVYFMLCETTLVLTLGLELISRSSVYLKRYLSMNYDIYFL